MGRRKKPRKKKAVHLSVVNGEEEGIVAQAPDPEVAEQPTRRKFTAAYKRRILKEADAAKKPGDIGALLRREGLYSSHLSTWRAARERGELAGLTPQARGPKPKQDAAQARKVRLLERENARLKKELEQARLIIDVQKKLSEMLGIEMPKVEGDE